MYNIQKAVSRLEYAPKLKKKLKLQTFLDCRGRADRATRAFPRRTESHLPLILLFDTSDAKVVWLVVRTVELDQMAIVGITPPTM